jgi:RNA polymerase sigma-70 factor, ECF subfamily
MTTDLQRVGSSSTSQIRYLRDPDVQLMLRTKAGDEAAFQELVNNYQNRLIAVFFHLVHDQEAAEDLAQEAFLRIYRSRLTYQPTAKFSTWLFRIAGNLASNSRRSKGRRREVPLNIRDSGPLGHRPEEKMIAEKSGMMPGRQLDRNEVQNVVQAALGELSDRQRMALLLHKFEGMSYADIGESMEMSAAAVKSLLSRARENLRERLEKYVR